MLAQQMQLANAMMPGAPLQPVVGALSAFHLGVQGVVGGGSSQLCCSVVRWNVRSW